MACHHPLHAWRARSGAVYLQKEPRANHEYISLPCGKCLGCRMANAKAWALRCHLENQAHRSAVFSTLTYSDENLPATLTKRHLQLWLKRLRKEMGPARPIRFFASGEYGEQTQRPHYHAILYGAELADKTLIEETWGLGYVRTDPLTPRRIFYAAGYTAKKIGWEHATKHERVDPTTGEVYTWQPPFIQMSRRPGIGGHARQWPASWRAYAIYDGHKLPVPRFLHEAWKQTATTEQIEQLRLEKKQHALNRDTSIYSNEAQEKIDRKQQEIKAQRRLAV